MQCPTCDDQKLIRAKYCGANVRECPACCGFLLDQERAGKLEKRVNKDIGQLEKEVELTNDTKDILVELRCPSCRNRMTKELLKSVNFHIDNCNQCDKAWFDGGELPRLQLAFESKPQTVELNRMRERLKNMTPAERAEYEARIAALRDLGSPFEQVVLGSAIGIAQKYYWATH